jgi:hypothetical protein
MGTNWEHDGNKKKKKNIPPPHPFQKRKNWTCREFMLSLSLAAWNVYFENSLSPYLAWANGMEQSQKRKKNKVAAGALPTPPSNRKKTGPLVNAFEPFIGCIETLVSKTVCHHFWPGLIALPKNTLPNARG